MIVKLNARLVDTLKPTRGARADYHDAEVRGLSLRVTERGVKTWSVVYRHRGRLRRLTLGSAKAITLADARDRAKDTIRAASKGADPATEKRERTRASTVGQLATEYLERHAKKHKRSWKKDDWILRAKVLPSWEHRAIADITRRDVRTLVQDIADSGAPIMANRTVALLSKLFKFALDDDLIAASPAVGIARPAPEHRRDRVLTEAEIRKFWTACEALPPEMAAYFKLRLITAQRGAEVAGMCWEDLDLDAAWWTIPAAQSKNKLAHRVPLSATALAILSPLREARSDLTPSRDLSPRAASRNAYVLAGARGKRQQTAAAATFPVRDFHGHDLRRTAASLMASGGIPRLVIGKILNHVERDITAVYDRHSYDSEKRAALDWWAVKLTAILERKDASKVLPFAKDARP